MTPMISSTFRACRTEPRFTPKSLANSRSGGNLAPGETAPVAIRLLMRLISLAVTRVSGSLLLSAVMRGIDVPRLELDQASMSFYNEEGETRVRTLSSIGTAFRRINKLARTATIDAYFLT